MMNDVIPLAELRNQIDVIDQQILQLINQRASLAKEVAITKTASGEGSCFYRPDREASVLKRLKKLNAGPLGNDTVAGFFRELMSACLALEKPLQVAFLGPEGTFTQQATFKHFGHAVSTEPVSTIEAIFQAVESGRCQFGVVPIENSTEGVVTLTMDRFVTTQTQICGEVAIKIQHNLLTHATSLNAVTEVYSHKQSLAQCRQWLDEYIPSASYIEVNSNAEAAKIASSRQDIAAIAGEAAAQIYNLPILKQNIEDQSDNTTRFVIIGHLALVATTEDKTSLLISTKNHAGALYRIIEPFAKHDISMSRIESRPSRQGLWDYLFFIDIDGHQTDQKITTALKELTSRVTMLKILGSYPKAIL